MLTEKNTRFPCLFIRPRDALLKFHSFVEANCEITWLRGSKAARWADFIHSSKFSKYAVYPKEQENQL